MEQISTHSSILKPSFKKINLINKHWHLSTLIKQVCGSGLLFPKVSLSQDSKVIFWDATYRGAFLSSLFSNNDNKPQRDSKNRFFKADVHGRFTACSRNKLLILKKNGSHTRTLKYKNRSYQLLPAVFKDTRRPAHACVAFKVSQNCFSIMQIPVIEIQCASKVHLPVRQVDLSSKQSRRGNLWEFLLLPFSEFFFSSEAFHGRDIIIKCRTNGILANESRTFHLKSLR